MKNRYEKIVLEAEKDITFNVSEGTSGELIIRVLAKNYSGNHMYPPILEGYKYVCGEWNNGFVIERCSDGSQFVWIPVGSLDPDGKLYGENFSEKFGKRNYEKNAFTGEESNKTLNDELCEQCESVKKYGGFYISRFNISKSIEDKPQSVKGAMPWVEINFYDARKVAADMEKTEGIKSHLVYESEYDSVLAWLIKSKARTYFEIASDSSKWGNYSDTENSLEQIAETGSREEWSANNIYDLAGNVEEWVQIDDESLRGFLCGGSFYDKGSDCPSASIGFLSPNSFTDCVGFRVALYIK